MLDSLQFGRFLAISPLYALIENLTLADVLSVDSDLDSLTLALPVACVFLPCTRSHDLPSMDAQG